ncbi:hypothetical protein NDU88_004769 [Pleurodeles waltl]|uniref:Secreted protein n=1 Tax=Pleurodeles waltl TaxID=8319 RepID=A0AAV7V5S6_PLEWA|nr:hypothetical protein NDU88_004769 [Pleurodeles waltl]
MMGVRGRREVILLWSRLVGWSREAGSRKVYDPSDACDRERGVPKEKSKEFAVAVWQKRPLESLDRSTLLCTRWTAASPGSTGALCTVWSAHAIKSLRRDCVGQDTLSLQNDIPPLPQ